MSADLSVSLRLHLAISRVVLSVCLWLDHIPEIPCIYVLLNLTIYLCLRLYPSVSDCTSLGVLHVCPSSVAPPPCLSVSLHSLSISAYNHVQCFNGLTFLCLALSLALRYLSPLISYSDLASVSLCLCIPLLPRMLISPLPASMIGCPFPPLTLVCSSGTRFQRRSRASQTASACNERYSFVGFFFRTKQPPGVRERTAKTTFVRGGDGRQQLACAVTGQVNYYRCAHAVSASQQVWFSENIVRQFGPSGSLFPRMWRWLDTAVVSRWFSQHEQPVSGSLVGVAVRRWWHKEAGP